MRLTKLKIAGFKSFVDPTTVTFPEQPDRRRRPERLRQIEHHRCGALGDGRDLRQAFARRVDGGRDFQRLRRAQAARQRLGGTGVRQFRGQDRRARTRATTRWRLRRSVSRDGTSDYFINGIKVRRKDITQLFLGTGLGTRSYAIIEQGMISRVIEARPGRSARVPGGGRGHLALQGAAPRDREPHRRRRARISTGLNDLREEVEKQIRHLQRQAGHGAPLSGAEGGGAQTAGRSVRAAPAESRRGGGRARCGHRALRDGDAGGARGSARGRSARSSGFASISPRRRMRSAPSRSASTRPAPRSRASSRAFSMRASCS